MVELSNNSVIAVHDIFDPLPSFMLRADTLFVDVPYNQALLTNFSNREGARISQDNTVDFHDFTNRLGVCIREIAPAHCFVEVGKEALADFIYLLRDIYQYTTFYNATYYRQAKNKCYVIHATNEYKRRRYQELEDMDESDIVAWLCANHQFTCIGDLCMGEGLVGKHAFLNGKAFVGIDINPVRLQVLIDFIEGKHV